MTLFAILFDEVDDLLERESALDEAHDKGPYNLYNLGYCLAMFKLLNDIIFSYKVYCSEFFEAYLSKPEIFNRLNQMLCFLGSLSCIFGEKLVELLCKSCIKVFFSVVIIR